MPKARRAFALYVASQMGGARRGTQTERIRLMQESAGAWRALAGETKDAWKALSQEEFKRQRAYGFNMRCGPTQCAGGVAPAPAGGVTPAPPAPQATTRFGDYEALESVRLGQGSYGLVIPARHVVMGRKVAIKLFFDGGHEATAESRVYEGLASQIPRSDAFLPVLAGHLQGPVAWLVTPLIAGGSVRQHLKASKRPFAGEALAALAQQVREGLCHLHRQAGFVHLDIKPANLLWAAATHQAYMCDFSLSEPWPVPANRRLRPCYVTEDYRPPELFGAVHRTLLTPAVDAWSFGCTLFEAATGCPFSTRRTSTGVQRSTSSGFVKAAVPGQAKCRELGGVSPCLGGRRCGHSATQARHSAGG